MLEGVETDACPPSKKQHCREIHAGMHMFKNNTHSKARSPCRDGLRLWRERNRIRPVQNSNAPLSPFMPRKASWTCSLLYSSCFGIVYACLCARYENRPRHWGNNISRLQGTHFRRSQRLHRNLDGSRSFDAISSCTADARKDAPWTSRETAKQPAKQPKILRKNASVVRVVHALFFTNSQAAQ